MDIDRDIHIISEQERLLHFDQFDEDAAWELGQRLRALAEAHEVAVAIEIRIAKQTVFFHVMPGTTPANADWARRKRNVVELMHASSYRVGLEFLREDASLEERLGLDPRDHAAHGGSFPIHVEGVGVIGNVTVSGLPQRDDHSLVVTALVEMLGQEPTEYAIDSPAWDEVAEDDGYEHDHEGHEHHDEHGYAEHVEHGEQHFEDGEGELQHDEHQPLALEHQPQEVRPLSRSRPRSGSRG